MKKQQLSFFLSIVSVLYSINLFAQGTIKGSIIDSVENEPLLGAEVRINDPEGNFVTGGATDFVEGIFSISIEAGTYQMVCSYMGYASNTQTVTVKDGETSEVKINMAEEVNVLKVITKTASRFETPVGKSSISLDVIKPSLIDNTNATRVDQVIDKVPGVTVVDGQANIRGGSGYSYGAGSRVLLLVDDMPFLTGDAGQPNWQDIPVENISQIEIVKGAASALYGSSALNGIINIRTAYAKNKPFSKVSVFHTTYMTPDRPSTAWWNYDYVLANDLDESSPQATDTIAPAYLSGREGYRVPMQMGVQFAHRRKINKFDLTLGGNYFYSDSYRMGQYQRKFRINSNMRYRFSTKVNAGVNINFNYGTTGSFFIWNNSGIYLGGFAGSNVDTAIYIPLASSVTESTILRFNIDPFFTAYDKKGGRHRLQTRYYQVDNSNLNQSNKSNLGYAEYQYQKKFKIKSSFFGNLKFVTGVVGQYTFSTAQLYGNAEYDIANAALYVQAEQGFFKSKNSDNCKLNIIFGARVEYNSIHSPDSIQVDPTSTALILNPEPLSQEAKPVFRLGLNYEVTPFTFIRASWGQGYRYPTIAERYITTLIGGGSAEPLSIRANPELSSETGWSAELGIKQGFKIGNWKGFADLSAFWTEYQNMMEFTFGGGKPELTGLSQQGKSIFFQSINIDDTRIRGFEVSIMGTGNIGPVSFNVMTGYTYISPEFQNWDTDTIIQTLSSADYNVLKYRNRHSFKLDIEAFFLKSKALSIGFYFNYNSKMEAIDKVFEDILYDIPGDDDIFGVAYYRNNFDGGEMFDIGARIGYRHPFKNKEGNEIAAVKLSLVGKNLLNREHIIRPAFIAAPANITVRLDVEF